MKTNKILIVDDDMTALDLMDIMLERAGYEVVRHTDANWVLENIESLELDAILLDIMMPKLSGDRCIEELRNKGHKVPIIAFTALNDPELHTNLIIKGANLVLTKPCKTQVLLNHLSKVIEERY